MFLKRIKAKEGKEQTYWALVKSVRTARGPRHQVVSYLGELQAGEKSEWANLARIANKRPIPRMPLFDASETTEPVPETIEVRVCGARVERTRDFGNVYLALTLWRARSASRTDHARRPRKGFLAHCCDDFVVGTLLQTIQRVAHCRHVVSANVA